MSGFPRGRASTGCFLALLVLAGGTGCVKRPFHEDAGTRSTEPKPKKESGGIKTYKQLLGEFGQEWVWMPASKITLYSVKRCPTSLGPVAEFHLRKTKQAARWDALWAVACVQKGKGLGFIYSGEINDNQDPSQNLINTVHVDKGTLGNRLPEAFAIKHAFGGCNMAYSDKVGVNGLEPSLEGTIARRDNWFEFLRDIVTLPHTMFKLKECITIDQADDTPQPLFAYHAWRTVTLNIFEKAFIRKKEARDRWDLNAKPVLAEKAGTQLPSPNGQTPQEHQAQELPPDGNVTDESAKEVAAETASDDLAAIWSNPLFRTWLVRDLRKDDNDAKLITLISYPIILETTRWGAWKPAPTGEGSKPGATTDAGAETKPAQVPPPPFQQ